MSSLLICTLLYLTAVGSCAGEDDPTIDEIDRVNKELMKEDNDDDDGGETKNEEHNEHQYERNMKHNVRRNGIYKMNPNCKDSGHFGEEDDIERKTRKNGYNTKNMGRWAINRRVYEKRYLHSRKSGQKKQASRRRGSVGRKREGGKRLGYKGKGRFDKNGYNMRRYRKKKTSRMKINMKNSLRGNRYGKNMRRRGKRLRSQGYKRKGKGSGYVTRYGYAQNYNQYRKMKIRNKIGLTRQRRTRRLKSLRRHTGMVIPSKIDTMSKGTTG